MVSFWWHLDAAVGVNRVREAARFFSKMPIFLLWRSWWGEYEITLLTRLENLRVYPHVRLDQLFCVPAE